MACATEPDQPNMNQISQSLPEYKDNDRKHNVWKTIAVNMECGGMFGLYVNKYLKFLKCFDISLQSSRNIHQNRIVMLSLANAHTICGLVDANI